MTLSVIGIIAAIIAAIAATRAAVLLSSVALEVDRAIALASEAKRLASLAAERESVEIAKLRSDLASERASSLRRSHS